jgi:hypothetical protein
MKSAASRSSIGVAVSLDIATSTICPMIELIGPICGTVFAGNWSRAAVSRSLTCWRLR